MYKVLINDANRNLGNRAIINSLRKSSFHKVFGFPHTPCQYLASKATIESSSVPEMPECDNSENLL